MNNDITYSKRFSEETPHSEISEIIALHRAHRQVCKDSSAKMRKALLKKLAKTIKARKEDLCEAVFADFKKAHKETLLLEVFPSLTEINHNIEHLEEWMENVPVANPVTYLTTSSEVIYEPKGSVLIISPWNYPIYLSMSALCSAVAAGNTVILKPSELIPNTTEVLESILSKVFQPEHVKLIKGGVPTSQFLLQQRFDHIHFTGSPRVGKIVMESASKFLTSLSLELGGKSPVVFDDSADLKMAAKRIVWGKFINGGQTCICPDYILVDEKKELELLEHIKKEMISAYGDNPKASPDLCRLISQKNFDRVRSMITQASSEGAEIVHGGDSDEDEFYIEPTLLRKVDPSMKVMQEEIFGPLLPVLTFKTLEEASKFIRDGEKPLSMYVFSSKKQVARKLINETSAGGGCINDIIIHISQPNLPFGGVGNSGMGKSHGKWGFVAFSNERSIVKQHSSLGGARPLFPPYTKSKGKLINAMIKWLS